MKKTLEKGVEENALELALRGEPRDPFYMVGRMGDQSVVIRAEKGKVKMLVDDDQELVYDATKGADDESQEMNPPGVRYQGQDHRRFIHLDRTKEPVSGVQRDENQLDADRSLAKSGHGRDARSVIAEKEIAASAAIESAPGPADRQKAGYGQFDQTGQAIGKDPEKGQLIAGCDHGAKQIEITSGQNQAQGPADHEDRNKSLRSTSRR